jgi:hypothetical protein
MLLCSTIVSLPVVVSDRPISVIAPSRYLTWKRPFAPCASIVEKICRTMSISENPVRRFQYQGDKAGSILVSFVPSRNRPTHQFIAHQPLRHSARSAR